ncbi:MAG: GntR family transcriptional regulator [Sphingobium sp.]
MKQADPVTAASERIADFVAERILSGHLPPGSRIKQDELAAELGLSRIPVRDALRMLEIRGLVSMRANAGAFVTSFGVHDMETAYKVREKIEPMLLEESMPYLTEADIEEMRDLLDQMDATTDVEDYLPLDRAFHWVSYRGNRTLQLTQMVERLWDTTQSYRRAYTKLALKNGGRILATEHKLLFGAIERREIEMAQSTLVMHIRRTRIGLAQYGYLLEQDPVVRTSTY